MSDGGALVEHPPSDPAVVLKELSPRHKQVMALLAQGVDRQTIAKICNYVPEYITWLARQPACKLYLEDMANVVGVRLEALFEKSVDVIAETMVTGNGEERLKAARLQLEATKRLGRHEIHVNNADNDRLEKLAERILTLNQRARTFEGEATVIES